MYDDVGRPCCFGVRNANNVYTHAARTSSTCGVTESFCANETPSTLITAIRLKPAIGGGSVSSRGNNVRDDSTRK